MTDMAKSSALTRTLHFITRPFVVIANFTRHLLLLLVFLILLLIVVLQFSSIEVDPSSALVVAPKGFIVEEFSGDAGDQLMRKVQDNEIPETRMRDLDRVIRAAASDERITVLVLNPDFLWGAGLANLRELGESIEAFKQSGKPVIAIASSLSQGQYYLASLADEVLLDPQGFIFLTGFGAYRNYFKDGLDKLGVDVHLFRVGEYKSAAEPFVRNDMSPEAKDAGLHFLNDLWDTFLDDIAAHRGIAAEDLRSLVEDQANLMQQHDGNVAEMAQDIGLVDRVMKRQFMHKYIAELSAFNEDGDSFRGISHEDYLTHLQDNEAEHADWPQVAVVVAEGAIVSGEQPPGTIGGVSTAALLQRARLDERVKAVVLRVNSPGGGVFPSEQIRREVDAIMSAGKPVVVSMGNVAASGGYWISMTADSIWADEATITGSIGIYGMLMTFPKLFDKLGIHSDGVGTTKWVGAFRPDRELDEEFARLIQSNIEYGYQQFIASVAHARGLEVDMVDKIARGRVWTARQAHELGLVDHLGGLSPALADAAQRAGIGDQHNVVWVEQQTHWLDRFVYRVVSGLDDLVGLHGHTPGTPSLSALLQRHGQEMQLLDEAMQNRTHQFAYCFCNLKSL